MALRISRNRITCFYCEEAYLCLNDTYCPNCGHHRYKEENKCPDCGRELRPGQKFCTSCGRYVGNISPMKNEYDE